MNAYLDNPKEIIRSFFKAWILLLALPIVFGGLAYFLTPDPAAAPPVYKATSSILMTNQNYNIGIEPFIGQQSSIYIEPSAIRELAETPGVLSEVYDRMGLEGRGNLMLSVTYGADQTAILLSVQSLERENVVEFANTWADVLIQKANFIYATISSDQLDVYTVQIAEAGEALETAEANLVAFQTTNQSAILSNKLTAKIERHAALLSQAEGGDNNSATQQQISELEAEIAALQGEKQTYDNQLAALEAEYQIEQETYRALELKIKEAGIYLDMGIGPARLMSHANGATALNQTGQSQKGFTAAVAAVVGLVLAVLVVFVWNWWKADEK